MDLKAAFAENTVTLHLGLQTPVGNEKISKASLHLCLSPSLPYIKTWGQISPSSAGPSLRESLTGSWQLQGA